MKTDDAKFDSESVSHWVEYIQTLHVREVELSLERVRSVFQTLCPNGAPFTVISVAGTNGKGSTSELLSSIYQQAGYRVGKFTSPHLVRFNERFNVNGSDIEDPQLLLAFRAIESVRGSTAITYFEYGLLLAMAIFMHQGVEVAVMEVGLGGRLDAVNILDADVAIITSIALDHTAWLGDTLEQIAFEKAGIARPGKPCVVGVREPQLSMIKHLNKIGAKAMIIGRDFDVCEQSLDGWGYFSHQGELNDVPLPFMQTGVQLSNAALAITAVKCLSGELSVRDEHIKDGVKKAQILGRCQLIQLHDDSIKMVLDVSHNEASMIRLAEFIKRLNVVGRVVALCGMLQDKEIAVSLSTMSSLVSTWHLASITATDRGASASHLYGVLRDACPRVRCHDVYTHDSVVEALDVAIKTLTTNDCLVVFGSFFVAGDIIQQLTMQGVEI